MPLGKDSISRFRTGYVAQFGPANADDPLYESVSAGRKQQGMEHWLPLFYPRLDTLFDFVPRALFLLGHQTEETKAARIELVKDYFETREQFRVQRHDAEKNVIKAPPYKPLKPELLYLSDKDWTEALARHNARDLSPFQAPESMKSVDAGGKVGRDFQPERAAGKINVFQSAADHIAGAAGREEARHHRVVERRFVRTHGRRALRSRPSRNPHRRELARRGATA